MFRAAAHPALLRAFKSAPSASIRSFSKHASPHPEKSISERFTELVPQFRAQLADVKKHHGEKNLGHITVNAALGGMRSLKCMVYETSLLDADEGIRFRGYSIPECQEKLPKATKHGGEPLPEGLFWLLLTGEVPTKAQVDALTAEFHQRSTLPRHVIPLIHSYPKHMHPMTQLKSAVLAMQTESKFYKAYQEGKANKNNYWQYMLEDSLDLIARLPQVCAAIYRHTYRDDHVLPYNSNLDWAANFSAMLGPEFDNHQFHELMRLYMTIHSDHEGGNVSAHATHLVGSALSDPYVSYTAGMAGLAGPLHGLANQEVLRWILDFQSKIGGPDAPVTTESISKACWDTLNSGQVIPGYGHAVLRKTDPRYTVQREFALKYMPSDPLFKLVSKLYEVVPDILTKHGKTKNPWPNVDAHSGVLLRHYKLKEQDFYTVLFGMSRALGVLSSLVIHRALGFPIERPKSVTLDWLSKHCH